MAESDAQQIIHMPSNPPGWTAGKYAEWYPDVLVDGALTTEVPKPGWASGFLAQHDRLLAAASAMPRLPLFVSGDIHGQGSGHILASAANDFRANPIVSIISGTPGTGVGWPSAARGTVATPAQHLALEPITPIQELNGFHLLDVEPDQITISHFRWHRGVDSAPTRSTRSSRTTSASTRAADGGRSRHGTLLDTLPPSGATAVELHRTGLCSGAGLAAQSRRCHANGRQRSGGVAAAARQGRNPS